MGELYNLNPRLPKNIRQIGERDQVVKLYVEDYVNTYLRRLYPAGGEDLRCGLLLGSEEEGGKVPCIFIDGALEMEGVACGKEQVDLNDQAWKRAYRDMEEMFPKRSVQGWFLCGAPGCQLSPLNYWKQHSKYFPGKNKIMYLNSGLEGEEALYMASDDGFYRLRGYCVYYERNQMMQDYMIARKDVKRVDAGAEYLPGGEEEKPELVLETGVTVQPETMTAGMPEPPETGAAASEPAASGTAEAVSGAAASEPAETGAAAAETGTATAESAAAAEPSKTGAAASEPAASGAAEAVSGEAEAVHIPSLEEADQQMEVLGQALEEASTHVVQDGETLYGICLEKYHDLSRVDEVCRLNGLEDVNKIKAGQKLILP